MSKKHVLAVAMLTSLVACKSTQAEQPQNATLTRVNPGVITQLQQAIQSAKGGSLVTLADDVFTKSAELWGHIAFHLKSSYCKKPLINAYFTTLKKSCVFHCPMWNAKSNSKKGAVCYCAFHFLVLLMNSVAIHAIVNN